MKKYSFILSVFIIILLLPVLVSHASSQENPQKVHIGCLNSLTQNRFRDHGDGTITDHCTNLLWQKGTSNTHPTWAQASAYCSNLTLGGLSGWRVPTIQELFSIVNYSHTNGTYAFPLFDFGQSLYPGSLYLWSSTPNVDNSGVAWQIQFTNGNVSSLQKSSQLEVRCVLSQ
ncbi:MAG TPA: DUF1566 domain-containing protein [Methylomirabilota bacterium]|nr:DUF1566 domain-containing protein [Methylomirabilota bacterium]